MNPYLSNYHKVEIHFKELYQDIRFQLATRPHLLENLNLLTEEQFTFFIQQIKNGNDPIELLESHVTFILEFEVEKKTKQLVKEYAQAINEYFGITEKPKAEQKTLPLEVLQKYAPPKTLPLSPILKIGGKNSGKFNGLQA